MSWGVTAIIDVRDSDWDLWSQELYSKVEAQNAAEEALNEFEEAWDAAVRLIECVSAFDNDEVFGVSLSGHAPEPNNEGVPAVSVSVYAYRQHEEQ